MSLSTASFAISIISLIITVLAFILEGEHRRGLRLFLGVPALLITLLFGLIGFFSSFGGNGAIVGNGSATFSDLHIPANANTGVTFTAPVDGSYKFTLKTGIYCTAPNLCRNIIRGYVDRDIVWGDWYGKPHPVEQNYELGCWEDSVRNNPECAIGNSTTISMKAQQIISWVIMEDRDSFGDNTGEVLLAVEKLP